MADALRTRLRGAVLWSAAGAGFNTLFTFGISIVLARVLSPRDFGLVAMLTLFVSVTSLLCGGSSGPALVYRRDADTADVNAMFWTVAGLSGVGALGLVLSAPWIAKFYGQPALEPLTRAWSVALVLQLLIVVPDALLQRELRIAATARIGMVGSVVHGAVAITLALRGAGAWSFLGAAVAQHLVELGLKLRLLEWRPGRPASSSRHRELLDFTLHQTGTDLIGTLTLHWDSLLIGRWLGPARLGLYRRARTLPEQVLNVVMQVGRSTIFPTLAHVQDDPARVRNLTLRAFALLLGVIAPALAGIGCVAQDLVVLLYGERWASTGPLMQVVVWGVLLWSTGLPFGMLFQARGRPDLRLRMGILRLVIEAAVYLAASRVGTLPAYAWAFVTAAAIMFVLRCVVAGKLVEIGLGAVLQRMWRSTLCVGVMVGALQLLRPQLVALHGAWVVGTCALVGTLVYLTAAWLVRLEAITEARSLLRRDAA